MGLDFIYCMFTGLIRRSKVLPRCLLNQWYYADNYTTIVQNRIGSVMVSVLSSSVVDHGFIGSVMVSVLSSSVVDHGFIGSVMVSVLSSSVVDRGAEPRLGQLFLPL